MNYISNIPQEQRKHIESYYISRIVIGKLEVALILSDY